MLARNLNKKKRRGFYQMSESSEEQQKQTSNDTNLSYWNKRWQENRIGFHRTNVNELFKTHLISKLVSSEQQQCVAFPLCGKSLDMTAVLDTGHRVIGIEGSQTGIEAFFNENNIPYEIEKDENNQYQIYKGTDRPVTIYCTDFFNFKKSLPPIDYIWDRGGLVAINPLSREQYRDCLFRLMTPDRTQLFLVAVTYHDPSYTGPPHKVDDDEVTRLFGSECSTVLVEVHDETEEYNSRFVLRRIDYMEERVHSIIRKQK